MSQKYVAKTKINNIIQYKVPNLLGSLKIQTYWLLIGFLSIRDKFNLNFRWQRPIWKHSSSLHIGIKRKKIHIQLFIDEDIDRNIYLLMIDWWKHSQKQHLLNPVGRRSSSFKRPVTCVTLLRPQRGRSPIIFIFIFIRPTKIANSVSEFQPYLHIPCVRPSVDKRHMSIYANIHIDFEH